jgi:hypothetical protein
VPSPQKRRTRTLFALRFFKNGGGDWDQPCGVKPAPVLTMPQRGGDSLENSCISGWGFPGLFFYMSKTPEEGFWKKVPSRPSRKPSVVSGFSRKGRACSPPACGASRNEGPAVMKHSGKDGNANGYICGGQGSLSGSPPPPMRNFPLLLHRALVFAPASWYRF